MYAQNFSQVGANIQKHLDAKGFTQQWLAGALQVSKQVMNKIIKVIKQSTLVSLRRLLLYWELLQMIYLL